MKRKRARHFVYGLTLLLLVGHGGGDLRDLHCNGCKRSSTRRCEGFANLQYGWDSIGTCTPGHLVYDIDAYCVAYLTLPDQSVITGSYASGVSTFVRGDSTCQIDQAALTYRCVADAGEVCSSTLVSAPIGDAGLEAGVDAGP